MKDRDFTWWYNTRVDVMLHMYHQMNFNIDEIAYIFTVAPLVVSEMLDIQIVRDSDDKIVDKRK